MSRFSSFSCALYLDPDILIHGIPNTHCPYPLKRFSSRKEKWSLCCLGSQLCRLGQVDYSRSWRRQPNWTDTTQGSQGKLGSYTCCTIAPATIGIPCLLKYKGRRGLKRAKILSSKSFGYDCYDDFVVVMIISLHIFFWESGSFDTPWIKHGQFHSGLWFDAASPLCSAPFLLAVVVRRRAAVGS